MRIPVRIAQVVGSRLAFTFAKSWQQIEKLDLVLRTKGAYTLLRIIALMCPGGGILGQLRIQVVVHLKLVWNPHHKEAFLELVRKDRKC